MADNTTTHAECVGTEVRFTMDAEQYDKSRQFGEMVKREAPRWHQARMQTMVAIAMQALNEGA